MNSRYAIYFVPSEASLLWRLGCAWHGRDPATGESFALDPPEGLAPERHDELVASARLYGFHATLKAPFALAAGTTEKDLVADIETFAASRAPFAAPALQVSRIGGFLALTLTGPSPQLDRLCTDCVETFDGYRAPASEAELATRRKAGLTARQGALLKRWGYPYVMDEWRFHMTLTTRLEEPEISLVERHLRKLFAPVTSAPLFVDRIALFHQTNREAPFEMVDRFTLGRPLREQSAAVAGPMTANEIVDEASRESMDGSDAPGYYVLRTGQPSKESSNDN